MFGWIPVGAMAKIIIPAIIIGSLVDIATAPTKPQQCMPLFVQKNMLEFKCMVGTSDLHITSLIHSPAQVITSEPVSVEAGPSRSLWYPVDAGHKVFGIYDATDITLRITGTKAFTETVTFSRVK